MAQKNYLGVGITFEGLDKGLKKSAKEGGKALSDFGRMADDSAKKGSGFGRFIENLTEGLKLKTLGDISNGIKNIGDAATGKRGVSEATKELDTLRQQMSQVLSPSSVGQFNKAILSTMRNTGISATQASDMAKALAESGANIDKANESLPMMGKLVGVMGLNAGDVAKMYGQSLAFLKATPKEMNSLVQETAKMQKSYQLTDLIGALPEVLNTVTENAAKFGKVNTKAAMGSAQSVLRLTAMMQKYGKSQQEALSISTNFSKTLNGMKESILDMSVGLEPMNDQIYDAMEAMSLMGIQGDEAFNMIMDSAQNPDKFIKQMQDQLKGLDEHSQLMVTQRIRRTFGDDIANQIGAYAEESQKAVKAAEGRAKGMGTAEQEFSKLESSMRNTLAVQEQLRDSAKDLMDVVTTLANKDALLKMYQAQAAAYDDLTKKVSDPNSYFGQVLKFIDQVEKMGILTTLFGDLGAKGGVLAGVFGGLFDTVIGVASILRTFVGLGGDIKKSWDFIKNLGTKYTWFGTILTNIGKGWGSLVRGMISGLGLITGLIKPVIAGLSAILGPVGAIIAGVVALGAAVYLIVKHWDTVKEKTKQFVDWSISAFKSLGEFLTEVFTSPAKAFEKMWDGIKKMISSVSLGSIKSMFGFGDDSPRVASAATTPTVAPKPILNQPGAMGTSNLGDASRPSSLAKAKNQDFNLLIKAIETMGSDLMLSIDELAARPVEVVLQGDAKKFFRAANSEATSRAGAMGMGNVVGS